MDRLECEGRNEGVIFVLEYLVGWPKMAGCCCVLRLSVCAWVEPRREGEILVRMFREDAGRFV